MNNILAQASRDAGYAALMEQAVPEFGLRKRQRNGREVDEEAILDFELFGHAVAPDRLLDGTVRHPAASQVVARSATELGAAASEGAECKEKRYPPTAGKAVLPCAVETWGYADARVEALFEELAALASQRQRDRGLLPGRWRARWRTQLSVGLAMDIGKALLAAIPVHFRPCCALRSAAAAPASAPQLLE